MKKVFRVSEFNELVSLYLDEIGLVTVRGEISQLRSNDRRWLFLTLKDEKASLPVFALKMRLIGGVHWLTPGLMVQVSGYPRLYQKTARFSLLATKIEPAGAGAIQQAFLALQKQLAAEGLFAPEHKKPLPRFPQSIGLITAPDSRAYSDFIKVARARFGGLKILFYPVRVQGEAARKSILAALTYFNRHPPDLLVLTRGGGSAEDLAIFNDEAIVRAVFASRAPLVCAIGHEADISLAEMAADLRASTPSNAAELAIPSREEILALEQQMEKQLVWQLRQRKNNNQLHWQQLNGRLRMAWQQRWRSLLAVLGRFDRLPAWLRQRQWEEESRRRRDEQLLWQGIRRRQQLARQRWQQLNRLLANLDYHRILRRGFSLTYDQEGKLLRLARQVAPGTQIRTILSRGVLKSKVEEVSDDN